MYIDIKIDWKNWEKEIKEKFNISTISSFTELNSLLKKRALLTTRCSKEKTGRKEGIPSKMYVGSQNKQFYKYCSFYRFNYGILSDLYGVVFDTETIKNYDVHPGTLKEEDFILLGNTIRKKMLSRKYKSIIFWNNGPAMAKPYFYMLSLSGLPIFYTTKLPMRKITL